MPEAGHPSPAFTLSAYIEVLDGAGVSRASVSRRMRQQVVAQLDHGGQTDPRWKTVRSGIEEAFVQEGQLRRLSLRLRACRESFAFTIARIVGTPTARTITQPGRSSSSGSGPK